jgi:hypothetical protein
MVNKENTNYIFNDNIKNYSIIALLASNLFFGLSLIKNMDNPKPICPEPEATKIELMRPVDFTMPNDFKDLLVRNKVVSITFGFESAKVGLVTLDGNFLNPCSGVGSECKFDGHLEEAHMYIAKHSGQNMSGYACPDRCLSGGISRGCKSPNTFFYCNNPTGSCANACN